ncbi:MAG: SDR family oxidoreductase [Yonghaparkia sp.]|nr:SDR family oxidoreductase [Microcella sp.]
MSESLQGRVAIVSGVASGQGRATAIALREAGARVIGVDRDASGLERLGVEHPAIETHVLDVTDGAQWAELAADVERRHGRIDALLLAAGVLRTGALLETSDADIDLLLAVNLHGVIRACRAVIPALRRAGGGSIVTWGSINSMVAEPDIAVYSATKGAVLMLTKSIAIEHARDDIRANCICPGGVLTPMVADFFDSAVLDDLEAQRAYQPLGLIQPEEVASVAVFLASDASRKMTGTAVVVDGGYTAL